MKIANPIYDVVFKYLLNDNKVARKLLGLILEVQIESLECKATEHRREVEGRNFTVLHLEFVATIQPADGSSQCVIIEIQKAKLPSDILRFRRYLAAQYADGNNVAVDRRGRKSPLPIISVYFLGHRLEHSPRPVIKVLRNYQDCSTGEILLEKEEFIESLTHDSYIIQIPELKRHRRTTLEKVLSVFAPLEKSEDGHYFDIDEETYPAEYREVIRRLNRAAAEPAMREDMLIEDEVLEDLAALERTIADQDKRMQQLEQSLIEKAAAIQQSQTTIHQKDSVIHEKDSVIQQQNSVIQEQEGKIRKAFALLLEKGFTEEQAKTLLEG